MSTAHINIGSNLGHRAALIDRAVSLLSERVGEVLAVSEPVESAPWGYCSPNPFLNRGVNVRTSLDACALLGRLHEIEREIAPGSAHRTADGAYADRSIDLDLICLDSEVVDTGGVTVPHPRMHLREFVLVPMARIWPDWEHPQLHLTPQKMIDALRNNPTP